MSRPEKLLFTFSALLAIAMPACPSSFALMINPTWNWTSSYSVAHQATIESTINTAIGIYEAALTTATAAPITINIAFGDSVSSLGSTTWTPYAVTYESYLAALTSHSSMSSDDVDALAHLPTGSVSPVTDTSGNSTMNMFIKPANMKALGMAFTGGSPGPEDASIGLKTSLMNLSRDGVQDSSRYDLQSVVMHEIDEALGLGSSLGLLTDPSPEDLFRYQAGGTASSPCATVGARSFDSSSSVASCFSINGMLGIAQFNQNAGGDYGDWISSPGNVQVQDAFSTAGTHPDLWSELKALDVIGYNSATVATPEPTTAILLLSGLGLAVGLRRRFTTLSTSQRAVVPSFPPRS